MESNLLLAIFVVLAASIALVPLAKWAGFGTVLGYLAVGVLIGPFGLGLVADGETTLQVAEFGVVMMLFLIGLELQPRELWRMRHRLIGLGVTQVVVTTATLAALLTLFGYAWQVGIIIGLALALSSTAIAMQTVDQRNIMSTDTGRTSLAVLLLQDVAVIPILAAIPILASLVNLEPAAIGEELAEAASAVEDPADWFTPIVIIGAFVAAFVASRFLVRPLLSLVARSGVREAFTALALALVIGAALLTQLAGLSPALGAFIGGVLLADSEYRHELESILEPFKGLLLGLFFISVGISISFDVLAQEPVRILALVVGLVAVKILVLYLLMSIARLHLADRLLVALLLSQAGEFAFVVLQFAMTAGAMAEPDYQLLTVVVALSMSVTPLLLFAFDRLVAPLVDLRANPLPAEPIDRRQSIVVLGYGRFGQIVTRMLRAQGFEMTLIDDDPAQIELMKRFGIKVFYGDGSRLDLLHAAGVGEARLVVIAVAGGHRIVSIAQMLRKHFPHVQIAARATDREHAHALMELKVEALERETFLSAISLGTQALELLGYPPGHARRLADAFERHDRQLLTESFEVRDDAEAYVGLFRRKSVELLDEVMKAGDPPVDKDASERSE
ncbi:monovalent cation:proton antiporter-2 (CPA2) family protein [Devosia nitrariae]|uniref:Potassium transporter n=1 Tax=Devosia nitrariae TaxID=2071872 RepID=A0ABQ5WA53_9HYPH|nr:monovalent cation:proton antiporter-2 (CPA2) family protein [Devosia nitrariae]GLQ56847.1 potassium transporter [Devosia nitrariae]